MGNLASKCLMGLRMKTQAKFIFSIAIFAVLFCSMCAISFGEKVEPIHITGKVINQDDLVQKNMPLKFTIYTKNGKNFSFEYTTNSSGEYYVDVYNSHVAKISVTASKFGGGGYNEGIFKPGDTKKMNVVMIQNPCPLPVLIRGNIKYKNGSIVSDAYVYLEVSISVQDTENTISADNKESIEKVIARSTYTNNVGDYVLIPSAWTISEKGADAEIFVTDQDYNILFSDKIRISCGSSIHKDILIEEKNTAENGTSNSEKSNVSEGNVSGNSDTGNGSDNNNNNSFLHDPLLISLIVIIGVIILSVVLFKYSKKFKKFNR